jgi:hypothetical protein
MILEALMSSELGLEAIDRLGTTRAGKESV